MNDKPIQVFLRHCYHSPNSNLPNRHRPEWFDKTSIFENFLGTLNPKLVNYTIVYDEHFGEIGDSFLQYEKQIEIINCGNEAASFSRTLDLVRSRNYSDDTIVYFLEDDYLHRPKWPEILLEAFTLPISYVSLYDHLDKYIDSGYESLVSKIFVTDSIHWRTVPSTCNSYATKFKTLKEDFEIHKHYSDASPNGISMDHNKFVHLSNLGKILITSIPGYSTHCDHLQSPTIDWKNYL